MIKAILTDIEGTLLDSGHPVPGAAAALAELRRQGLALRFLTNTTAMTPAQLAARLRQAGIEAAPDEIDTAATACAGFLRRHGGSHDDSLIPEAVRPLFQSLPRDPVAPDFVVIGDIGELFDFRRLNAAFLKLRAGARLLAMQKNLFWFSPQGPQLDCGAFVQALEAASNTTAIVTGKPAPLLFETALAALGVKAAEALVVGDDPGADVAGAQAVGASAVLVRTGKGAAAGAGAARHQLASIAGLPDWLARH